MYRKGKKAEYYTELAKKQNYPARSVYKLKEIDEKYRLFRKGDSVLDLGCAPGSWLLYVSGKVGSNGIVVGVDIDDLKIPERKNIKFVKKSVFEINENYFSEGFDSVISDMAPSTTGVIFVDSGKSLELAEQAFLIAKMFLKPGGNFVCKIFDSKESADFFKNLEKNFEFSKRLKPMAVRKESKEFYFVAKGFKKILLEE